MFISFQTVGKVMWNILTGFSFPAQDPALAEPMATTAFSVGAAFVPLSPPPRDIWQCPHTFLVVTTWRGGGEANATGI